MNIYEKLYHNLFNAATDAIWAIDRGDAADARMILIRAQQKAEEDYINGIDEPEKPDEAELP